MNEYMQLLGHKCRDRITELEGIVTSVSFDLYGCVQVILNPGKDDKGALQELRWFDINRVVQISTKRVMEPPAEFLPNMGPEDKPAR